MNEADPQTKHIPLSWWHSLMYATSILLVVCGIPATALIAFSFSRGRHPLLERSDAFVFGLSMIAIEVLIAVILHFVAAAVTKRKLKTHSVANEQN